MIKAKKDLGQNFLIDEVALNKIIEIINPNKKEHFLEIGPGQGALTKFLAKNTRRLQYFNRHNVMDFSKFKLF